MENSCLGDWCEIKFLAKSATAQEPLFGVQIGKYGSMR